jgi:hypothetical protein
VAAVEEMAGRGHPAGTDRMARLEFLDRTGGMGKLGRTEGQGGMGHMEEMGIMEEMDLMGEMDAMGEMDHEVLLVRRAVRDSRASQDNLVPMELLGLLDLRGLPDSPANLARQDLQVREALRGCRVRWDLPDLQGHLDQQQSVQTTAPPVMGATRVVRGQAVAPVVAGITDRVEAA